MYYNWPWDPARSYACLDTGIRFVDRALSFYEESGARARPKDERYYFALGLKATYFALHGIQGEAERFHQLAKKGFHGNYTDYRSNIYWYYVSCHNFGAAIENYLHYLEEKPHDEIISGPIDYYMFNAFCACGFPGLAKEHSEKILQWEGDTLAHHLRMRNLISRQGNFPEAVRRTKELMEADPDPSRYLGDLAYEYLCMGDKDQAMQVTRQRLEYLAREGIEPGASFMIGYYYMQKGDRDKAKPPLLANLALETGLLEYPTEEVQLGIPQLDIALTYSILGNREKTLEYMARLNDVQHIDIRLLTRIKSWPTFDLVRDTPEFKNILKGLEGKFEEEHEKIANHLREHGINPA
jgi:tetratricopeptide (TPR) repeat protein